MSKIRFGVIGCGAIAVKSHLPALKKSSYAEIVAVVDTDAEQLQRVRNQFGVPHALLNIEQLEGLVDAVIIATPNATHYKTAKILLEKDIHVLCDKPLALSMHEAEDLYKIADARNRILTVSYNRRFSSNIQVLRQIIQNIQVPVTVEISLGGDVTQWPARSQFRFDRASSGGGCVIDTGVHIIDMAIYLLGAQVQLKEYRIEYLQKLSIEDNALIILQFNSGSEARLSCSYTYGLKSQITVSWEAGWAQTLMDNENNIVSLFMNDSLICRSSGIEKLLSEQKNSFLAQIDHFCECVQQGITTMIRKEEVLAGQLVIDQIYSVAKE